MIGARIVLPVFLALVVTRGLADPFEPPGVTEAMEGGTAVGASADVSSIADAADRRNSSGNPLWSIPLSSLSATRERPLFSSSRRPPPIVVAKAVATAIAIDPETTSAPQPPALTLMGTIVGSSVRFAILANSATGAVSRVRQGDQESGWRVRAVELRSVIVEKDARSIMLELPKAAEILRIAVARK
jgi:general secretion pathway protein N